MNEAEGIISEGQKGKKRKLSDKAIPTLSNGKHLDDRGLYVKVRDQSRLWVLIYQLKGRRREMSFGPYPDISLKEARLLASEARTQIAKGIDPLEARIENKRAAKRIPTFGEIAELTITEAKKKTPNAKNAYQWEYYLGPTYCGALLKRPVNEITTLDVAETLRPVWDTKPGIADKLLPAIRRVFEHARVILRDGHSIIMQGNPANWSDLKAMGFEAARKLSKGHQPSLPYHQTPAFIAALRANGRATALALEFLIQTATRTDSVIKAKWDEINFQDAIWTIPLTNLKDKKTRKEPFRVPLTPRAIQILKEAERLRESDFIFPGQKKKSGLSNMAFTNLLKRMFAQNKRWVDPTEGRRIVAHGFRATFRTWAEEQTSYPHTITEEAMGHTVGNAVERAYRRTDILNKRRSLMLDWMNYIEAQSGTCPRSD